jgi:hypothetical protein
MPDYLSRYLVDPGRQGWPGLKALVLLYLIAASCIAVPQSLARRRRSTPPHCLLWWSFSRSFHQALMDRTRPDSTNPGPT